MILAKKKAGRLISAGRAAIAALMLGALLLDGTAAFSAFLDPYWSSRVAALGGAYTAVSDDATGVFYNQAAGVGKILRKEANFSYAKLFTGLDGVNLSLNQLAFAQPLGTRTLLGVGWGSFSAASLYREDTMIVGLARSLKNLLGNYAGDLSVGVSVKYLMRGYTLNDRSMRDPVFRDGTRNHTAAVDLHLYSVPEPNILPGLSLGLTVRNINRPNTSISGQDQMPLEIIGGLAYRWRNWKFPVDVSLRNGKIHPRFGTEILFMKDRFALRFGGDPYQAATGFGYTHDISRRFTVVFDYSFIFPIQLESTTGSHRATLGLKF